MRKLYVGVAAMAAVALVACPSAGWRRFKGPDGRDDWFAVHCTGGQHLCWQKAGTLCLHGYHLYDQNGREELRAAGSNGVVYAGTQHKGEMVIRCKDAPQSGKESATPGTAPGTPSEPPDAGPPGAVP